MILPLAHFGHYLWLMYIPPVLIVLGSIVKTTLSQRREGRRAERDERKKG
jgi:heme exporter protein D